METVMSKTQTKHADIKEMTFERALKELESIVTRLEKGDVELEEFDRHLRARRGAQGALRPAAAPGRGQGREAHLRRRRLAQGHRAPRPASSRLLRCVAQAHCAAAGAPVRSMMPHGAIFPVTPAGRHGARRKAAGSLRIQPSPSRLLASAMPRSRATRACCDASAATSSCTPPKRQGTSATSMA